MAATEWALEEPYSKRPFIFGSFFADHLKRFDLAERIAREGLRANPDDFTLKNNLCFALLKVRNIPDAEKTFTGIDEPELTSEKVIFFATSGLLQFTKGNVEGGRELYQKAIKLAVETKDARLAARAAMNFAIAEIEAGTPLAHAMRKQAFDMAEKLDTPDISLAREELLNAAPGSAYTTAICARSRSQ